MILWICCIILLGIQEHKLEHDGFLAIANIACQGNLSLGTVSACS